MFSWISCQCSVTARVRGLALDEINTSQVKLAMLESEELRSHHVICSYCQGLAYDELR